LRRSWSPLYEDRDYQWQNSIDGMHRLVTEHPNDVDLILAYFRLLYAMSQYSAGVDLMDHWLEVDPLNPYPYLQRGLAVGFLGDTAGHNATLNELENLVVATRF
jgi:hypothetical protein